MFIDKLINYLMKIIHNKRIETLKTNGKQISRRNLRLLSVAMK